MAKAAKKPRNRAAQDATLINQRALKSAVQILRGICLQQTRAIRTLDKRLTALEQRSPIRKLKANPYDLSVRRK